MNGTQTFGHMTFGHRPRTFVHKTFGHQVGQKNKFWTV